MTPISRLTWTANSTEWAQPRATRSLRRMGGRRVGVCPAQSGGAIARPRITAKRRKQVGAELHAEHPAERAQHPPDLRRSGEQCGDLRVGQQMLQLAAEARRLRCQPDQPREAGSADHAAETATPSGTMPSGTMPGGLRRACARERGGRRSGPGRRGRRTAPPCGATGLQIRMTTDPAISPPALRAAITRHSASIMRPKRSVGEGGGAADTNKIRTRSHQKVKAKATLGAATSARHSMPRSRSNPAAATRPDRSASTIS
jgi:hypothetical protein